MPPRLSSRAGDDAALGRAALFVLHMEAVVVADEVFGAGYSGAEFVLQVQELS
jgi:hypothetical protein